MNTVVRRDNVAATAPTAKKVGLAFFRNIGHELPRGFKSELRDGLVFSTDIPQITDPTWEKWLGLDWESVTKANAVLRVQMATTKPHVLDEENKSLTDKCTHAWIALMLTGPFYVDGIRFATGSEVDGELNIRQTHTSKWIPMEHPYWREMTEADVLLWSRMLEGLTAIYTQLSQRRYQRLNRGLLCFQKACEEVYADFRIPMFVRAVEALVLPNKGETTKQFVARSANWWPKEFDSGTATTALREIYEMRCDFDHLHGLKEQYSPIQLRRAYEAEALARSAYQNVLTDEVERNHFASDDAIRAYWQGRK